MNPAWHCDKGREHWLMVPRPYEVKYLKYNNLFDWKAMSLEQLKNVKIAYNTGVDGQPEIVQWLKIKWLCFGKSRSGVVQFKYDLHADSFFEFNIHGCTPIPNNRRTRKTPQLSGTVQPSFPFKIKGNNNEP